LIIWLNIFFMSRGTTSAPAVDRLHSSPRKEVKHEQDHLHAVHDPNSSRGHRSGRSLGQGRRRGLAVLWHLQKMRGRPVGRFLGRPRVGKRSLPTDLLRARSGARSVVQVAETRIATNYKKDSSGELRLPGGSFFYE